MPSVTVKFAGKYCVVPEPDDDSYAEAIGKANRFLCPVGPEPGIGYVLVLRKDWDSINGQKNSPQKLEITASPSDSGGSSGALVLPSLYIVSACQISGGKPGDTNSAYLVKLTDKRWIARMSSLTLQVNMRCPAPPRNGTASNEYYQGSLNSGSIYQWPDLVSAIWNTMPILGSPPSLPYSPNGVPECFNFLGVNAWDALNGILERLSCVVVYDPQKDKFTIQKLGVAQDGLSSAINAAQSYILDDISPFDIDATLAPEKIRVQFNDLLNQYGTQVDTNPASGSTGQWATSPPITKVDQATNIDGAIAGTLLTLWDDFPAIYDFDGTFLNSSDVNARASERVTNWVNDYKQSMPRRRTVYTGMQTKFAPGSQLKYVWWKADGGNAGATTEVGCYPGLSKITDQGDELSCVPAMENIGSPDLSRKGYPIYPNVCQWITITNATINSAGFFEGKVTRVDPGANMTTSAPYIQDETCWVVAVSTINGSASTSPAPKLVSGERYLGRLNGSYASGSDGRPVYAIEKAAHYARFLSGTISSFTSGSTTMTVVTAHDGISPGSTVTVYDADGIWGTISSTTKCKAYWNPDDRKYYLLWVQC